MRPYFEHLADAICQPVAGIDRVTLYYSAEVSDFIRFNRAAVRQATHVSQRYGSVSVVAGARQATGRISLSGDAAADVQSLLAERDLLIEQLPLVPEDAFLQLPTAIAPTERDAEGELPSAQQVIDAVTVHAAGTDLVGFYAGGPVSRGFADSRGQRNWHRVESFHFEWCLYRSGDQAVKSAYAGTHWDETAFAAKVAAAREQVELLARPRKTLEPGEYRVYFSPVAVADLLGTLSWGGFGHKDVQTGVSTLIKAHRGEAAFHPSVTLVEDTAQGIAPRFQADGFVKPDSVALVGAGAIAGTLVSPRTATEYGTQANGANSEEWPESLAMAGGLLAQADVLRALGTGVYISDLHYLNYSDRQACRMTGMTRFACFWVENGHLVAPIPVMRFDDSLLRMFGSGLIGLTEAPELVPDSATYEERHLRSVTAPGALVEGFRFTL
ncbi:metallopeptidase TldD-related protein [Ramlibacter sp. WS9]|uniref:metallopeptidase TldD-related protein n=1 Tax=Ramlibacter sp. WS9 TaxID=1882741 RepID=UPI0011443E52|nr:metallopeptidase TldD-related protein [Ramlibacter sp. WS9]ROZ72429.1 TldE/PmbA family protein [Ramlibacter sp. WS9]